MNNLDWSSVRTRSQETLTRLRTVSLLNRLSAHMQSLSQGDRFIVYVLSGLVGIASLLSLLALEQSILVQVPAYGGSLAEGTVGSPQFINPLLAISDADRDLSVLTYAGLMGLSKDGALVPILAEKYVMSGDGKTYTFTLRDDTTFTDGTPLTADDVVFTIGKAKDVALKSPEYANWSGVTVVALDARTVRFTLAKPYAPFLELTTLGILPAHLWRNISDTEFPFSTLETNPVGSGPFKIKSISRDASGLIESVSLVVNQRYVLGRPYLDSIHFNFYANTDLLTTALKNGSVESAYGVAAANTLTAPYARVFGVFFNPGDTHIYARPEVRKALSLALDRPAIVETVLGGSAIPIMGPVPPGSSSIKQTPVPASSDPIATAAHVLEAAGWTYDGDARVWKNAAAKQSLDTITIRTSNVAEMKDVALAVKTDWEKLGIGVDIELYEPGDLSQNVIRPRKYGALLYGMVIGRDQDLYAFWDSQELKDPGLNIALYANKTIDALLEDARGNPGKEARMGDLQKIEDIIAADYPAAFLYAPKFSYAVPTDLSGIDLPQIIVPADRFATVASWYRSTDAVWPIFTR